MGTSILMEKKRIVARGIIFIDDKVVLLKRIRLEFDKYLHYYAIPGGGLEENETKEMACLREIKEAVNLDVTINKYLKSEEYEGGICRNADEPFAGCGRYRAVRRCGARASCTVDRGQHLCHSDQLPSLRVGRGHHRPFHL